MDAEMSLDDFIKKKGIKMNTANRKRRDVQRFKRNENSNKNDKSNSHFFKFRDTGNIIKRGNVNKGILKQGRVRDARLKIIQKARSKIMDAREKLAQKAKQTDARLKLTRILEKQKRTKKVKYQSPSDIPVILRSVNPAFPDPSITIKDEDDDDDDMIGGGPVLRLTVKNNRLGPSNSSFDDCQVIDDNNISFIGSNGFMNQSTVIRRPNQFANPFSQFKIVTQNESVIPQGRLHSDRWEYQSPSSILSRRLGASGMQGRNFPAARSSMNRERILEEQDYTRKTYSSRISQELKARLDTPAAPSTRSMGVLSNQSSVPPPQPQGHRIVVSNLQPSVTHEDIKELFEDIGPLVTSHVVRPGTAEVIYVEQKDAIAAVDAYHNRQLDGQPMKCMLVNPPRPPLGYSGRQGTKYPSSTKSTVIPDIAAIHKALFHK